MRSRTIAIGDIHGCSRALDKHCSGGGWLTALDVHSLEAWQTNKQGELRSPISN